jgi:hypothetical protein
VVIEEEGPEIGATRLDKSGSLARWATTVDGLRFKEQFLNVLNG